MPFDVPPISASSVEINAEYLAMWDASPLEVGRDIVAAWLSRRGAEAIEIEGIRIVEE